MGDEVKLCAICVEEQDYYCALCSDQEDFCDECWKDEVELSDGHYHGSGN